MPAFIKPWKWKLKPPVGSQINWGHPLGQGLMGCFLLNEQGPILARNLYSGKTYGPNGSPTWESKIQLGYSLISNTNNEGIAGDTESFLQFTERCSLMWRGSFSGSPGTNINIAGVAHNNTDSSPYQCYMIWSNGSTNLAFGLNNGSFQQNSGRAMSTFTDGLVHNFVLTINTNTTGAVNDQSLYSDNAYKECGGAVGGAITYGATTKLVIGNNVSAAGISNTNSECVYIWNRQLRPSDVSWLWYEPYCMIQPPRTPISYFFFGTGTAQSLSCIAESASEIVISASNAKALNTTAESQGAIQTGLIASYTLSTIAESASSIDTLLYHEYNLPTLIAESASEIKVLLGKLQALSVVSESASTIQALVGKQIPLSIIEQSASSIEPSLSRVFVGGIAAFDVAVYVNPPIAALDTGNRPVAFLLQDNDNEGSLNPNIPNISPADDGFFV